MQPSSRPEVRETDLRRTIQPDTEVFPGEFTVRETVEVRILSNESPVDGRVIAFSTNYKKGCGDSEENCQVEYTKDGQKLSKWISFAMLQKLNRDLRLTPPPVTTQKKAIAVVGGITAVVAFVATSIAILRGCSDGEAQPKNAAPPPPLAPQTKKEHHVRKMKNPDEANGKLVQYNVHLDRRQLRTSKTVHPIPRNVHTIDMQEENDDVLAFILIGGDAENPLSDAFQMRITVDKRGNTTSMVLKGGQKD